MPAVGPGPGFGAVLQPLARGRKVHEGFGGRRAGERAGGGLSILCGSRARLAAGRQLQLRGTWRRARSPPMATRRGAGMRGCSVPPLTAGRACASAPGQQLCSAAGDGSCCHADGAARSPGMQGEGCSGTLAAQPRDAHRARGSPKCTPHHPPPSPPPPDGIFGDGAGLQAGGDLGLPHLLPPMCCLSPVGSSPCCLVMLGMGNLGKAGGGEGAGCCRFWGVRGLHGCKAPGVQREHCFSQSRQASQPPPPAKMHPSSPLP